ncbi:MAG TPA: TfoX/Sxy family protein [Anaerolineae bacterium]|nr:TfoX/Sxy family protein [Anaerolineae bacterium]
MAYDEGLAERIRMVMVEWPNVGEKKMFGGLAFMVNDYMCCGVLGETLMARVGKENYEMALAKGHVREMDFTGRSMKGYVYVAAEGLAEDDELAYWVELCRDFVLTLPPKKKK